MSVKSPDFNEIKNNFINALISIDKEQLTEFVNSKGKEPKKIKPFICLPDTKVDE